jgi:hypothetical protein
MIHVLNAPSPAATASISIGKTIAAMAAERFDFPWAIHTEDRVIPVGGEPASWP